MLPEKVISISVSKMSSLCSGPPLELMAICSQRRNNGTEAGRTATRVAVRKASSMSQAHRVASWTISNSCAEYVSRRQHSACAVAAYLHASTRVKMDHRSADYKVNHRFR